jgi:tetratricopeptide (TPR) repeat protein
MLGHLGLAPGPDTGLAAAMSAAGVGESAAGVRRALRELVDANLISEDGQQRYRMHDLVRLYAIELAAAADGGCALTRLLDHYLHTGYAALELLRPLEPRPALASPAAGVRVEQFADRAAATAWFAAEYQVLVAAVRSAAGTSAAAGADGLTWQLASVCLYQLDQRGDWAGQVAVSELALAAARRLGDDTALAHAHTGLGRGYAGSGRFDTARAEFNHALAAYRRLGDPVGEGFTYRKLARVHAVQGRPADALAEDRRALARFEAAGHDYGRAVVLNALGWHLAHLGRYAEAVDCCLQAIALQQRLPDPYGEALTWDSIAYAWYRQGDYNQAVTAYRRAARLIREQRNHLLEAQVLEHLGDAYAAFGSQRAACAAWRRAADLLTGLGHPHVEPVHAKLRRAGVTPADAIRVGVGVADQGRQVS